MPSFFFIALDATLWVQTKSFVMNNTGKIITAMAAGAALGAILGVLLAPDKGSEIRKKINEEGKKITGKLKDSFEKGKRKLDDLKENFGQPLKEEVDEFA